MADGTRFGRADPPLTGVRLWGQAVRLDPNPPLAWRAALRTRGGCGTAGDTGRLAHGMGVGQANTATGGAVEGKAGNGVCGARWVGVGGVPPCSGPRHVGLHNPASNTPRGLGGGTAQKKRHRPAGPARASGSRGGPYACALGRGAAGQPRRTAGRGPLVGRHPHPLSPRGRPLTQGRGTNKPADPPRTPPIW